MQCMYAWHTTKILYAKSCRTINYNKTNSIPQRQGPTVCAFRTNIIEAHTTKTNYIITYHRNLDLGVNEKYTIPVTSIVLR